MVAFAVAVGAIVGLAFGLVVVLAAVGVLHLYRVPSSAMEPTLHCARPASECEGATSDRIIVVDYILSSPARGDLVAFRTPPLTELRCGAGGTFLKRISAIPGDRWEERDGYVYVNGTRLAEPYITTDRRDSRTIAPTTIPAGQYFVLGDNRVSSCDSRAWGTVPRGNLIGKVSATYWPLSRISIR